MKRAALLFCVTIAILALFSSCSGSQKQCQYCESTDVEYEAIFVMTGTREYLCEECYQRRNENPTFDETWSVKRVD